MGSRGLGKGPEHRGYFVSASALYDLASASILISTKTGLVHVMAELPRPGRAPISCIGVGRAYATEGPEYINWRTMASLPAATLEGGPRPARRGRSASSRRPSATFRRRERGPACRRRPRSRTYSDLRPAWDGVAGRLRKPRYDERRDRSNPATFFRLSKFALPASGAWNRRQSAHTHGNWLGQQAYSPLRMAFPRGRSQFCRCHTQEGYRCRF